MVVDPRTALGHEERTRGGVIDCDVHAEVPGVEALFPYLPGYWVEHVRQSVFKGPTDTSYPKNAPVTARPGSAPAKGPAGSSLALLREQVLDPLGVDRAILNCTYAVDSLHNPDAAVAFSRAVNDWLAAEWLDPEPRLRASIVVPSQIPQLAADEVARVAPDRRFVQVLLPVRSRHPYGSRIFHPMWDTISRHDLVAGLHFGGTPGNPPTPSGWPSYFFEEWAGMAQVAQSQLVSIISEGVFDEWPNLRVTVLECGFNWLPAFCWRFDKEWRNLRRLVPWVRRAPSAYIHDHFRFTAQPLDRPADPRQFQESLAQLGSDDLLLYASDYPHQHAASVEEALLPLLSEGAAQKIARENARAWYHLADSDDPE